jgi:hypothetical protein
VVTLARADANDLLNYRVRQQNPYGKADAAYPSVHGAVSSAALDC